MLHRPDYADNGDRLVLRAVDLMANRVFFGKVLAGDGLVDKRHQGRILPVGGADIAAAAQRYSPSFEDARHPGAHTDDRLRIAGILLAADDLEISAASTAAQREHIDG